VTVADLSGRLTAGDGAVIFHDKVNSLLSRGVSTILLNMVGLQMMDSSGLGELSRANKTAQAAGAQLKLVNVGADLQRVLRLAGLSGEFEIFDNELIAVESFQR
jgi:anti-anti-sigma factor